MADKEPDACFVDIAMRVMHQHAQRVRPVTQLGCIPFAQFAIGHGALLPAKALLNAPGSWLTPYCNS